MARPIKLKTHRVLMKAPCEMVFQKVSSFGMGRLKDDDEPSRVISKDGNRLVVEFKSKVGLFTYTTLEEIILEPPERITFRHIEGPLHYAWERFTFTDVDGDTELTHEGEFIWSRMPIIGWFGGMVYTRPVFERTVKKHMEQIRLTCEARAQRSHVFRGRHAAKPE